MLSKRILIQYCELKKETRDLTNRIEKLEEKYDIVSDTVQTSSGFPYKQHSIGITGYNAKKYRLLTIYRNKLRNFNDKLLEMQNTVEDEIEKIDDSALRQILRYRYIDGYGWIKIMHLMDYESESKARMKHDRFLEKIS